MPKASETVAFLERIENNGIFGKADSANGYYAREENKIKEENKAREEYSVSKEKEGKSPPTPSRE